MQRSIVLMVMLVAACGGSQAAAPPTTPLTPEAVVVQVKGVMEQWRQAQEVRSIDGIAPLYEQSSQFEAVHQGRRLRGWPNARDAMLSFFASHSEVKILLADLQVVAIGDTGALVAANMTRRFGDGVTTVEEVGAATWVLRRAGDSWKIIAETWSYAPPMP